MSASPSAIDATHGDAARHRPLAELEAALRALPPAPRDTGRLAVIVRRPRMDARESLARTCLTPEEGLPGDMWSQQPAPRVEAQLAVMRNDVAGLIANGQPVALCGDNLYVDFDLSTENLPAGSQLRVGEAVLEVTPLPHNGCRKFKARFGNDALQFVNQSSTRLLNLRGIYCRVISPGEVEVGAAVEVLFRPPATRGA